VLGEEIMSATNSWEKLAQNKKDTNVKKLESALFHVKAARWQIGNTHGGHLLFKNAIKWEEEISIALAENKK
jgi:hypothetical protein